MTFPAALLDHQRTLGDPPADAVIATLASRDVNAINALWDALRRSDDPIPGGMPDVAARFLGTSGALPVWADAEAIRVGEQVFAVHGPALVTGLFCSALPHAYACARGAEVLVRTGRMRDDLRRRIDETAQMVFDVCGPGGLGPEGRGIRTLQKVRLIHAAVRHAIRRDPTWDAARLGTPINPEDLAGTMLTFSWATGRAVELLGGDLSAEEWEGWLHLWRVAAALIGVPDVLIPADKLRTEALWRAIMGRQQAPSLAGRLLTGALVEHINGYLPGRLWDGTTGELMRTFLGDGVADWLGVPHRNWTGAVLAVERRVYGHADDERDQSALLRGMTRWFNLELLDAVFFAERHGKQVRFRLPTSLRQRRRRLRLGRLWSALRT